MSGLAQVLVVAAGLATAPAAQPAPALPPQDVARSKPPVPAPEPGQGPVTIAPDSTPPTSATTREAPAPRLGAPTTPVAVSIDAGGSGVTPYLPAFFAEFSPSTAMDMVNHVPGFAFDGGDSSVRGYSGAAGNVLIDGRLPASKSDGLSSVLSRINASDVERIDLIRGGAPGVDMQGRTVILNVIRKKGDATEWVAQAGAHVFADGHSIPQGSLMLSRRSNGRSFDVTVSRFSSFDDSVGNGRYVVRDGGGGLVSSQQARTSADGGGVTVTGAYKGPLFGGDLRLNGRVLESYFKSGQSYGEFASLDDDVNDRSRDRQLEIGGNYDRKIGEVDVEAVALQRLERSFSGEAETARGPYTAQFSGVNRTGESIARLSARYSPWKRLTLEVGGEGAFNFLEGSSRYRQNGVDVPLPSADVRVEETRGEFFGQSTWRPLDSLTLEAAVRFETSSITETGDAAKSRSFFYAKPRFAVSWSPDKDSQLRLRIEKKVGQLDFGNFISSTDLKQNQINVGNPDLRPDQRWQYEAAYERRFWGKGSAVVTLTHEEITDVVDLVPIVGPGYAFDAPGNIGAGTADTLDIQTTLPLDRLGLKGGTITTSTTWRTSEVTDPVTGQKRRISSQRGRSISLGYSQDLPSLKSTVGVNYDGLWNETAYRLTEVDHRIVTPPFLQLYGEYKPQPGLSLRLELTNLIPYTFKYRQDLYAGPRNSSPVQSRAELAIQSQPRMYFRIRKVFR
jgi:outer membrane receptor protein involved in Fe transport